MKYMCLLAAISILPLFGACALINDAPRHTADEVATIAKSFTPGLPCTATCRAIARLRLCNSSV